LPANATGFRTGIPVKENSRQAPKTGKFTDLIP
jgi:hypothetical protein